MKELNAGELTQVETMTSREIAELTGKEHSNVMRDIRNIVENLGEEKGQFIFEESYYINQQNKEQPMYKLDKKSCLLLASGYSVILRARIINRWEELELKEQKNQLVLPNFNNPAEAARAWASEYEAKQQALLEANEAKERVNKLIHIAKTYTSGEIAKELNIKSAMALNKMLEERKIQFKQNGTWLLYSDYADKGYTSIKQIQLDNGHIQYDRRWTGSGRDFILDILSKDKRN